MTVQQAILDRLELLESREAITATLHRYGHAVDYGDRRAWLDCFMPNAVLEYVYVNDRLPGLPGLPAPQVAAMPRRYSGHGEIGGFIDRHTRPPERYHKHYLMAPVIEIATDRSNATARSYFLRVDLMPNGLRLRSFGRYLDRFERADDQWRIVHRRGEIEWSTALERPEDRPDPRSSGTIN